jgi:SAM-dependent methyltransferase
MSVPTIPAWHAQFERQARWTQAVRNSLYRRAKLLRAARVLDVGCGTGVLTRELARRTRGEVIGLDLDPDMLAYARQQGSSVRYEQGDALQLPYPDGHYDVVHCHYVLLWVADAARAVQEMARVTRAGGAVLICAEPDYGGRIDWPDLPIRRWQIDGLRRQGADPLVGRRLRELLVDAGLRPDVGVLPSLWDARTLAEQFEAEWTWLQRDAGAAVEPIVFSQARARARTAVDAGTRSAYLPLFYALGRK